MKYDVFPEHERFGLPADVDWEETYDQLEDSDFLRADDPPPSRRLWVPTPLGAYWAPPTWSKDDVGSFLRGLGFRPQDESGPPD